MTMPFRSPTDPVEWGWVRPISPATFSMGALPGRPVSLPLPPLLSLLPAPMAQSSPTQPPPVPGDGPAPSVVG